MKKILKPWGHEEIWAQTDKYVGKILTITPGERLSLQYHEKKEETIYVLEGILKVWHSDDEKDHIILMPGDTFHVKPGQVHRFGAPKGSALRVFGKYMATKIIEVSTPELDDIIRIKDDYQR